MKARNWSLEEETVSFKFLAMGDRIEAHIKHGLLMMRRGPG